MSLLRSQKEKDFIGRYSTFASVENTLGEVVDLLLRNERLKRLLYYTDRKALHLPKLTTEQSMSLLNNQIKIVPKLNIDHDAKPYIILTLDNFVPDEDQTTFRSFTLGVDILCLFEFWPLEDFKLRPYAIAGEVDALLNKSFITKENGVADFIGGKQLILNENLGGLSLYYKVETLKDDTKLHPVEP